MGMYNTIFANCPHCGEVVDFQSKSGSCILTDYHISYVPYDELPGIMGDSTECVCGHVVEVGGKETPIYVNATHLIR